MEPEGKYKGFELTTVLAMYGTPPARDVPAHMSLAYS